jgi:hypothetical protein
MWPDFEAAVAAWLRNPPATPLPAPPRRPPFRTPPQDVAEDLATRQPAHTAGAIADQLRPRRAVRWLAWLGGWRTPDRSWRLGAAGERAVGARLDRLTRHGWRVLHGVTFGAGGDLDHLLIGPAGVHTVNTKHHPRATVRVTATSVLVRGRSTNYVARAEREAARVERALGDAARRTLHVTPTLVFHRHRRLSGWLAHRPAGVRVLPGWAAAWRFRLARRRLLTSSEIEQLYALARQPATWAPV